MTTLEQLEEDGPERDAFGTCSQIGEQDRPCQNLQVRRTLPSTENYRRNTSGLRKGGGRPKGSPNKATQALKAYAGRYTTEAIDSLVSIARNVEMLPSARVAAWREVLDRGNGKPPQAVTGPDGEALSIPASIAFVIAQQSGAENRT